MSKLFPILLITFPFSLATADAITPAGDEGDNDAAPINPISNSNSIQENHKRSKDLFLAQCYWAVPPITPDTNTLPDEQLPVNIEARGVTGFSGKFTYQDDVLLTQGNKTLTADQLNYYIEEERATAEGKVHFVNGDLTLDAEKMEAWLALDETSIYETQYQFHGQSGRGDSTKIYDNGKDLYTLTDTSYTACPPQDTTWSIDASTLYIDNETEVGTAYNAILKIKDVPVFYTPYFSYPLTDKRKTGMLFPTFEISSTNGFTYQQPVYINIAPNMDATITPTYMQERGTLLAAEYRYLLDAGTGKAQVEYLRDDKIRDDTRYLVHWDHSASFAQNWRFSADYNKVSDDFYFSDIDTDYGTRSDNQLLQTAKLSYVESNWNGELEVRDFQILGSGDTPHKVLPKVAFSAYQPLDWKSLQFDLYSEVTRFGHDDDNVYTGTRVHVEPKLSLPLYYESIFINTELKYMLSLYEQDIPEGQAVYSDLESSVTRHLPSFKVNAGINLERDFSFFDSDYRQTLVPQVQYLYVPYQDQSDIGIYDTTTMQIDYYGLFRDNRYSGYDRIADANQITLGFSSGILNDQGQEKMRFAIGQNYYLTNSRTEIPLYVDDSSDITTTSDRSYLIGAFDVNFENDYFFKMGLEWDYETNVIVRGNSTFEKRWSYNTFAQVNYRYIALSEEDTNLANRVNQLGTKVNWAIDDQWLTFASYYYDIEYKNTYESIIGIQYQSCCWALGLTYDHHMLPYYGSIDSLGDDYETEQSISVTFELMGLGGVGFKSSEQGLFDYGRPFYLK
ncbi:MAG: LPS assembly protein LptD [Psychromonas sp.]